MSGNGGIDSIFKIGWNWVSAKEQYSFDDTELDSHVPSVVVPALLFPTSNKPGTLDVQLATVLLPTPALPKKTFAVSFSSQEFVMIPFLEFLTHIQVLYKNQSCKMTQETFSFTVFEYL